MRVLALILLTASCGQDITVTGIAKCDGIKQQAEEFVDDVFDRDGDGFFDGSNPDCQEAYNASRLDCADADPDVNPSRTEVICDGLDNDCNPETIDAEDVDGDGSTSCEDCDDADAARAPQFSETECNDIDDDCDPETPDAEDLDGDGVPSCEDCNDTNSAASPLLDETCDDGIDNNCDGVIDEGCDAPDRSGTYDLDSSPTYNCALGSVDVNFNELLVVDNNPRVSVKAPTAQPGQMDGTIDNSGDFGASRTITGTCDETYNVYGVFDSETTFEATFEAQFSGGFCLDCTDQSWTIRGTKR